jgi:hypothetical protein
VLGGRPGDRDVASSAGDEDLMTEADDASLLQQLAGQLDD